MKQLLLVLVMTMFPVLAQSATYYVAQSGGNDANSGSQVTPFQTIQRCATVARAGDTCLMRAGTYRETVTPTQSGTASAPITFAPYTGESVTVSGAEIITGWTTYSGSIYRGPGVHWNLGSGKNQIFVDGQMMIEARWPNVHQDVSHPNWATAEGGGDTSSGKYIIDSHLTQPDGFWTGGVMVNLGAGGEHTDRALITGSSNGRVEFGFNSLPENEWPGAGAGVRYYLTGKLGALDTAGEAFMDSSGVYVWTPNSDNPSAHIIEVKKRPYAFDLSDKAYINVQGVTIFAAGIKTNANSKNLVIDGIHAKYTAHFYGGNWDPVTNVPSDTGILLAGSDNTIKNCEVAFSAGPGVSLMGFRQTVTNCLIHEVGYSGSGAGGIHAYNRQDSTGGMLIPGAGGHTMTYNTVYNTGYCGIQHVFVSGLKILHNLIYNVGLQGTDAGGAGTYTWNTDGGNTEIAYNVLHDSRTQGYEGDGIYLDDSSSNFLIHHNIVYNFPTIGIYLHEGGSRNNQVYNNTVWKTGYGIWGQGDSNVLVYNNLTDKAITVGTDLQHNLITSDPLFVDPVNGNFQLKSGSPAIDAGRTISGITDGYAASAPDIGAYEFGVTPWTAGAKTPDTGTTPPPAPRNLRLVVQ